MPDIHIINFYRLPGASAAAQQEDSKKAEADVEIIRAKYQRLEVAAASGDDTAAKTLHDDYVKTYTDQSIYIFGNKKPLTGERLNRVYHTHLPNDLEITPQAFGEVLAKQDMSDQKSVGEIHLKVGSQAFANFESAITENQKTTAEPSEALGEKVYTLKEGPSSSQVAAASRDIEEQRLKEETVAQETAKLAGKTTQPAAKPMSKGYTITEPYTNEQITVSDNTATGISDGLEYHNQMSRWQLKQIYKDGKYSTLKAQANAWHEPAPPKPADEPLECKIDFSFDAGTNYGAALKDYANGFNLHLTSQELRDLQDNAETTRFRTAVKNADWADGALDGKGTLDIGAFNKSVPEKK